MTEACPTIGGHLSHDELSGPVQVGNLSKHIEYYTSCLALVYSELY